MPFLSTFLILLLIKYTVVRRLKKKILQLLASCLKCNRGLSRRRWLLGSYCDELRYLSSARTENIWHLKGYRYSINAFQILLTPPLSPKCLACTCVPFTVVVHCAVYTSIVSHAVGEMWSTRMCVLSFHCTLYSAVQCYSHYIVSCVAIDLSAQCGIWHHKNRSDTCSKNDDPSAGRMSCIPHFKHLM